LCDFFFFFLKNKFFLVAFWNTPSDPVASVNIDAKLVNQNNKIKTNNNNPSPTNKNNNAGSSGIIELQNGCACCSLSDEFLTSVETLLQYHHNKTNTNASSFDAIVVELSGVADPVAIQNRWREAIRDQHPVTQHAELQNVITIIDSCTFGSDWMTWDMAGDRKQWFETNNNNPIVDCTATRKVVELLAEQVEAAHVLVLNKIDMAGPEKTNIAQALAQSLNTQARTVRANYGKVSIPFLLTPPQHKDSDDDKQQQQQQQQISDDNHKHQAESSHSHDHDHEASAAACQDPTTCTDPSHSHSHSHDHHVDKDTSSSCQDPTTCTDPSQSHSHSHDHGDTSCQDPDCTDPSHDHSHASSSSSSSTSTDSLGIRNFVYRADRPFDAERLMALLFQWPVPIKDELDLQLLKDASKGGYQINNNKNNNNHNEASTFVGVLRSKGFCWFAPTQWDGILEDSWRHDTAMYWVSNKTTTLLLVGGFLGRSRPHCFPFSFSISLSLLPLLQFFFSGDTHFHTHTHARTHTHTTSHQSHAGKHIGIQEAGRWWASVPESTMNDFFADNPVEMERILREDFVSNEFGDRRQELVFIGVDIDQPSIERALNECLLTDEEMEMYRENLQELIFDRQNSVRNAAISS
jgi:G3E family GTPase